MGWFRLSGLQFVFGLLTQGDASGGSGFALRSSLGYFILPFQDRKMSNLRGLAQHPAPNSRVKVYSRG
jgi:hypothetical protein